MIIISVYSGKADVYDHFMMRCDSPEELAAEIQRTKFTNYKGEEIKIETERDLALYFPYTIAVGAWSEGNAFIQLSATDHNRREELERIGWHIKEAKRAKRYCKDHNVQYDPETVYETRFSWWFLEYDKPAIIEIIRRIGEGGRQKWGDLRSQLLDRLYRKYWYEDLVNKYDYGERFAHEWVWHEGAFEDDEKWVRGHLFDK